MTALADAIRQAFAAAAEAVVAAIPVAPPVVVIPPVKIPPVIIPPVVIPPVDVPPTNGFRIGATIYPTLALAFESIKDGETLDIAPGDYPTDCGTLYANGCTINCNGAVFHSIVDGKATFNIEGNDTTINHPVGQNIHSFGDGNGGLIRMNGKNITVNDFECYDTDMPYLSGLHHPDSVETINRPKIRGAKQANPHITNIGHALYFGICGHATVTDPDIIGTIPSNGEWQPPFDNGPGQFDAPYFGYGHLVKSRAARLTITGGQLIKGPHTSRCIDACVGGILELGGGLHMTEDQSPDNFDLIGYGGESYLSYDEATFTGVRGLTQPENYITIDPSVVIVNGNPKADPYRIHSYLSGIPVTGMDAAYITMPDGPVIVIPPIRVPPLVEPPPTGTSLADLAATLAPGTWGELVSANINASLCDPISPNTKLPFHYCNAAPWDGSGVDFIGMDHGGSPGFSRYDAGPNRWQDRILCAGSHGYNFTAADGATIYRMICGGEAADPLYAWSRPGGLYKWNGAELEFFCPSPEPLGQVIAHHPICYWPGRGVFCWSGNTGAAYLLDMATKKWALVGQVKSSGVYHCVVVYSATHDCMVFGGGNDNGTGNAVKLWRIDADNTITPLPDAPRPVGIYNGFNLNTGPDGNAYILGRSIPWVDRNLPVEGVGEHYKLDLTANAWTKLADPPDGQLFPNDHDAVCSSSTPYGILYFGGRAPNGVLDTRARLYRC